MCRLALCEETRCGPGLNLRMHANASELINKGENNLKATAFI